MEIELFTLCNYAANNDGRLTIVDTIDEIEAEKFPWRAYFGIALRMMTGDDCPCSNVLSMRIVDDSRSCEVFEAATGVDLKPKGKFVLAGNLKGLKFDAPGVYHFTLSVGDKLIKDYSFNVKLKNGK